MVVNGYDVTIEDYGIWKNKLHNLELRARLKAEEMISLYQKTKDTENPQIGIVGADVVDNEGWDIRIFPDEKKVVCKFYKT